MGVNTYISIGNGDERPGRRLSQGEWSRFIAEMRDLLQYHSLQIHGEWYAAPDQPWQNANWCVEIREPAWWRVAAERAGQDQEATGDPMESSNAVRMRDLEMSRVRLELKEAVKALCLRWRQDSFAWATAPVELVETGYNANPPYRQALAQARAEGWLPPGKTHLNHEDRMNLLHGGPPTPGVDEGSTPPAPASTGDGKPWARTEDELRSTERKRTGGISA